MIPIFKSILLFLILILIGFLFLTLIINWFFTHAPYVPSNRKVFDLLFQNFKFKKGQIVYDLGCGDGRFLFQAEKRFGIKGTGFELAPLPYLIGQIWRFFGKYQSKIILGNFFNVNFRQADIIFCYLFPEPMGKVYQKALKECRPGTILISNTFSVKNVRPDQIILDQNQKPKIYIYKI